MRDTHSALSGTWCPVFSWQLSQQVQGRTQCLQFGLPDDSVVCIFSGTWGQLDVFLEEISIPIGILVLLGFDAEL